ncbi:MAG: HEAT repeat domain-containing protein [Bacteroidetes bacterium]|nr:HEAT repeat domain-containing protein [Bacteroidota bacterium]MBU2585498.1 HEAT repeat domain-containing protein [Bacteroidota bacterium]
MLTKEYVNEVKTNGNGALVKAIEGLKKNTSSLSYFLENLGFLPDDFDGSVLLPFISHESSNVRFWVVKNLGKLGDVKYIEPLSKIVKEDTDSMVRREAVSSLGRMRNAKNIPTLLSLLTDPDPKILAQAIRGLLVFKRNETVDTQLKQLANHPNELIQQVIQKEYFPKKIKGSHLPHAQTYDYLKNVVVNGDVREILQAVPDDSIHLTFTSPPYYNARDYSVYPSYKAYLHFLADVFEKVHRVTKEGRFFVLNTSPIIIPRVSRQHSSRRYPIPFDIHPFLTEMGWEFIDDIVWLKPEASVKNRNAGFLQHRKPLAYKPNPVTEYLMVYRKKSDKLIDWNIREYEWKTVKESKVLGDYETSNVWRIDPTFAKNHSAVFPVELCNEVIKFYSFKGDVVFDPFAGSGTVGIAANALERHFFLTEKDEKYFQVIKTNLGNKSLFSNNEPRFLALNEFTELTKI